MTLTEQWKKGELEKNKRYYVSDGSNIFTSYLDEHNCFLQSREEDTYQEYEEYTTHCEEVLAPVPSYEEWQQLRKWCEEFNALDVAKENQQLKEMLRECRYLLKEYDNYFSWDDGVKSCHLIESIDNAIGEKK